MTENTQGFWGERESKRKRRVCFSNVDDRGLVEERGEGRRRRRREPCVLQSLWCSSVFDQQEEKLNFSSGVEFFKSIIKLLNHQQWWWSINLFTLFTFWIISLTLPSFYWSFCSFLFILFVILYNYADFGANSLWKLFIFWIISFNLCSFKWKYWWVLPVLFNCAHVVEQLVFVLFLIFFFYDFCKFFWIILHSLSSFCCQSSSLSFNFLDFVEFCRCLLVALIILFWSPVFSATIVLFVTFCGFVFFLLILLRIVSTLPILVTEVKEAELSFFPTWTTHS